MLNNNIPIFFDIKDIVKYSKYRRQKYRANNPENVRVHKEIKKKLLEPTEYWLKSISVPRFVAEFKDKAQICGNFVSYTWGTIYKEKYRDKLIYFTVGVDFETKTLIYKLDCQKKGSNKLTKEQLINFNQFISDKKVKISIKLDEIEKINWDKLILRTNNFIRKNEKLYEDTIKYLWGNKSVKQPLNTLEEVDPPEPQSISNSNPSFKGQKNDFVKKQKESKKIGYEGELLVWKFENIRLKDVLKKDMHIEHTSKEIGDGTGYDIKSFDEKGKEIFIEVKTTKSSQKGTAFYITKNEIIYSKTENKSYWLYRVYNFNPKNKTGKVYRLNGDLTKILNLDPVNYLAVYKGVK
ncbi:MAG: protein NO VEIN domain-containing protein [Ignavibacteriaceae bacterium]